MPTHTHTYTRTQPRPWGRGRCRGFLAFYICTGTSILKVPVFKQEALKLVEGTEGKPRSGIFPMFPQSVVSFSNFKARLMLWAPPVKISSLVFLPLRLKVVRRGHGTGMLPWEGFPPPPAIPPA